MDNKPIIDFIEEQEIDDFTQDIAKKKRTIAISIIGGLICLLGISAYTLPSFLSKDHKQQMKYHANSFISNNENTLKVEDIKIPTLHSSDH
ncbi:TPA: hypothetical protein EYG96_00210 [Candidatus Gracilibacteria bacterium]|nr:hypothetical protein [Candidatus Peregrinibacteria bacterium]HIQ56451.1 hypothetical protein [Candidatus Gracilibacteria bacterium]HIQ57281.1 hypothetical protein [Candidatus Gracilibacteria bacterium]